MAASNDEQMQKNIERLLDNNRDVKVSELRTACLAAEALDEGHRKEIYTFLQTKVSGESQSMMAFCDLRRMYKTTKALCETRYTGDAINRGGLFTSGGLFALQDIPAGSIVTEFDTHAISSDMNNDKKRQVYIDPRILSHDDVKERNITDAALQKEALSLHFDNCVLYNFPLALANCPFRLMTFANDAACCPNDDVDNYDEKLLEYKQTAEQANTVIAQNCGMRATLLSTRNIAKDEEILVHWGAKHWKELRNLRSRGLALCLKENEAKKDEAAGDQHSPKNDESVVTGGRL